MLVERTPRVSALLLMASSACVFALLGVAADARTPTPDQIEAIQNLPQEQRDALMQQLSGGGSSSIGATTAPTSGPAVVTKPGEGVDDTTQRSASDVRPGGVAPLRIKGHEQLLISLALPATPLPQAGEQQRLEELRERIVSRNPYELSTTGELVLPGIEPIALAGLSAREAQQRLAVDPVLRRFLVSINLLRLEPQGAGALMPFGYEMFRAGPTTLVPGTDIPAPADYLLGTGDVLNVQLYGQQSRRYSLPVSRDGTVAFPELGPLPVGGVAYGAAQRMVEQRVRQQIIGTQARVTLGELRSLQVLVLGDAQNPGSYVLSGLSSVTAALFASGGVTSGGSLRRIDVKRAGKLIQQLDLYDVLLNGDTSNDVRLQSGDVVLVRPVGATVGVAGEVQRPAIYELRKEKTLGELIATAGGLKPQAAQTLVTLERIETNGERSAVAIDLSTPSGLAYVLRTGDVVRVPAVGPVVDNGITLGGHVYRAGTFAWKDGLKLSDIIRSVDDVRPQADLHYVLIRREDPATRRVSVFSADLSAALLDQKSSANIVLSARDQIRVFDLVSPREQIIAPLLEEIRRQSRPDDQAGIVAVDGRVNSPGTYPLERHMRVSDLLRAGGGLEDAAYGNGAELASYTVTNGERRRVDVRQVDLAAVHRGERDADVELQPYDVLSIKATPEWGRLEKIELVGEVRFPGSYQIRRGETLNSIVQRAGGLTVLAFPAGAVFTREELKARERQQLDRLADRLESDLAAQALAASQSNPSQAQSLGAGQSLLNQLRQAKPVGRLVIDLSTILAGAPSGTLDPAVRNGDQLYVPRASDEVSVLGEVQNPTSHLYRPSLRRNDLIALCGGVTARADKARIYIVRADGGVVPTSAGWLSTSNLAVKPGDTVVVPMDADKMRPLPLWTAVTTIIYNLAIAATAIARL